MYEYEQTFTKVKQGCGKIQLAMTTYTDRTAKNFENVCIWNDYAFQEDT